MRFRIFPSAVVQPDPFHAGLSTHKSFNLIWMGCIQQQLQVMKSYTTILHNDIRYQYSITISDDNIVQNWSSELEYQWSSSGLQYWWSAYDQHRRSRVLRGTACCALPDENRRIVTAAPRPNMSTGALERRPAQRTRGGGQTLHILHFLQRMHVWHIAMFSKRAYPLR